MKLSNLILKAIFFTAILSTFVAFIINTYFEYNSFQNEKQHIKVDFIEQKKAELKREVTKAFDYVSYYESINEKEARKKLKNRVQDAYNIATKIYNDNKNSKSENEIKYLIVTALENISYEHGAYFFINGNKGRKILFDRKSYLNTNINIWDMKDMKGNYTIRRQSNMALTQNEGFIYNYFKKPNLNDNKEYKKLSFIKHFEPYNWHIGMGEYLDDIVNDSKNEILKYITSIRFGENGYLFVNTLDKKALIFDGKRLNPPINYPNDTLFKIQLDKIKNKEGDFFFYKFKKLDTVEEYPKLAFVKKYDKWNWIIGTGIYIDEIDEALAKKEIQVRNIIIKQTGTIIVIFLVLLIVIFYISKKITSYIESNILNLIRLFKNASYNLEEINTKVFTFKEFSTIAKNLNKTLRLRNKAEKKVHELVDIVNKNVIISSMDTKGVIIDANDAFCKISGYTKDELIGKNHNIIQHPTMPKEINDDIWKTISSGKEWKGELKNKTKDGSTYWVQATIHPNYIKDKIVRYTTIRQDITDKKRVEYLSITDELTQTYNRRHFNTKIEEEINRAKRNDYYLSLLMLDIDHFKFYNDTYGHQEGDKALRRVAKVLNDHTTRATDFAFRLGGEEFGIIFSFKNEQESFDYATFIKKEIEALKIEHKANTASAYLTVSIGLIVRKGQKIENVHTIYRLADEALYNAKASGRNQICVST